MKTLEDSPAFNFGKNPFINILNHRTDPYTAGTVHNFYASDKEDLLKKEDVFYHLNNYGFRSDDFKKEHSSDNFLFAGCSQTFALGLPTELGWAYKVNSIIGGSKLINISGVSLSIDIIISNVINYIETFGNPKAILILFPDNYRVSNIVDKTIMSKWLDPEQYKHSEESRQSINNAFLSYCILLKSLESICESKNVTLAYSSWQKETSILLSKLAHSGYLKYSFNIYDNHDLDIYSYDKNKSSHPHYWKIARDNVHFGEMKNIFFAESFINQLRKLNA